MRKHQTEIQELLCSAFETARAKNPRLSMRLFAKKIGIHVSTISNIIRGNRRVSRSLAERILLALNVNDSERGRILSAFRSARRRSSPESSRSLIQADGIAMPSEALVVNELIRCRGFTKDEKYIARRLKVSVRQAMTAIQALVQAKIIELDEGDGRWVRRRRVGQEEFDRQTLNAAASALRSSSAAPLGDFSCVTVALDSNKLDRVRKLIQNLYSETVQISDDSVPDEVFKLAILLYPVTS